MEPKLFYRVANLYNNQGLWYDRKGNFTGKIHDKFSFCKNSQLPMPFDKEIVGFLSVTPSLEELFVWFPKEDIAILETHGYYITLFCSEDYKEYKNHWIINQYEAMIVKRYEVADLKPFV